MKLIKKASGKQTVKISKREWENIGNDNGWVKIAGVKNAVTPVGQQAASALNPIIGQIQMPDLSSKARAVANQLIDLIDQDQQALGQMANGRAMQKEAQVSGKKRFSSDYLATEYVSEQNGSPVEKIGPISEDSGIHKGGNEWTRKIWRFKDPTAPIGSGNEVLSYFMEEYTETIADGSTMAEYYIDTLSDEREPRQRPITPR